MSVTPPFDATHIDKLLAAVRFKQDGLLPVIVCDANDGAVLMLAYADRAALVATLTTGRMHYYSRSRQKMWMKGEESGHFQYWQDLRLDCDRDTLLAHVRQEGGIACHTGRRSCFFVHLSADGWQEADNIVRSSEEIYGKS